MKRKGQMTLEKVPSMIIILLVLALVIAVGQIVQKDVKDVIGADACSSRSDTYTSYDSTNEWCGNSTGSNVSVGTSAFNATASGETALDNVSNQLGTVGTILIAAVLLGLIVVAFVFFRRR